LAIATGGAALVGAAALVSVSLVAGMSPTELQKLGVAATAGTIASAAIMGTAWAIVSTFAIEGSLAGAAAISATMATLGGATAITGGAALIAFGVGLGVWQFLKDDNAALAATLRQIEPTLYVISEAEEADFAILPMIKEALSPFEEAVNKAYLTPKIPIDNLANVLSSYAFLSRDEKVLAVVDTSIWNSGKAGITFTDCGIWWNDVASHNFVEYSDPEYLFKIKELPVSASDVEEKKVYELALRLGRSSTEKVAAL
jgi:MFS family permease